uniref:SH2 domain-containing protein n=1 Tax=Heterorhabditis bacteriophora TaxID=37862 RepID=A0A1I7XV14_HETBA
MTLQRNGQSGWFPSNYVEETVDNSLQKENGVHEKIQSNNGCNNGSGSAMPYPSPTPMLTTSSVLECVIALYAFEASTPEELSFRKGEKLDIVDHPAHDPDWWQARNSRGQEGLVPKNYIEVVSTNEGTTIPCLSSTGWSTSTGTPSVGSQLSREPWYFGRIGRDEADRLLSSGREGEFLVRDSESNPGDLSISMRGVERNKHFKVQSVDGQLHIGSRSFPSMATLIQHYTTNPIFSSTTEKLYLTRPLPK